ncbi:MAG TPA: peptide ABC transporter substrate-binding protein [Streptosporangiaceae bacterium]|nr:peptide ABC transporter substrate-binding protein [Streptosporangiaceae bacterium]
MRRTHYLAAGAALATAAIALAGCGASSSSSGGHAEKGGTVSIAWPATPNFIFPLVPVTNSDGYNGNLADPMWPTLVYEGDGALSAINPQESLYSSLTYSGGDKTITIVLKKWKWSDGVPITARDFTFAYNLIAANRTDWDDYVQGLFPDDVASVTTPDGPSGSTVVINLTQAYNPNFYTEDVLNEIPLLPQHAWDKTSATGPVGNYDATTAGAKAVWNFLQKEGGDMATFATNPLWKVVDGPWALSQFGTNGYYSYVPNKNYSGPDKPILSKVENVPYTTDTAELDALRAGNTLDVGGLPLNDLAQANALKAEGYSIATQPIPGVAFIAPNLYNASVGPILQQLYVRQAMEYLIDRTLIVSKVYNGYADPGNGPVSILAAGQWVSPLEKRGGPYPYDPTKAIALLKAHGWTVTPNGTSTCASPGSAATQCGAGITKGEPLSLVLAYSSGSTSMDEQEADIQSTEALAGIKITLKSEPFNSLVSTVGTCNASSHPASQCGWQLVDFGYDPYPLYPAGDGMFNTDGSGNLGGYSSTEMNSLINATEFGSNTTAAFYAYEDYAAQQLPWLWVPDASNIAVYKSDLHGYAPLNPFSGGLNPELWYYTS